MARPPKTVCPISREQFRAHAPSVEVTIQGTQHTVPKKEFSTGSLGWYLNGKMQIEIDGQPVTVQIGLNLTIVGSKDLPRDAASPAAGEPAPAAGGEAEPEGA